MKTLKDDLQECMEQNALTLENLASPDRDSSGRFTKGNKGGGRKKLPKEFHDTMKANATAALRTIVDIMNDHEAKPELRLKAAIYILDHSYGAAMVQEQHREYQEQYMFNPFEY